MMKTQMKSSIGQAPACAMQCPSSLVPVKACRAAGRTLVTAQARSQIGEFASRAAAAVLAGLMLCSQPALAANESEVPAAVAEYVDMDSKGKLKSSAEVDKLRQKYRLRRSADGRLQLRGARGDWFQVRLDMEVPGSMLLRDPKGGVFAIQTEALQQIDLSDDLVALMMFADGEWEKQMAAVEYQDEEGKTKQLQLQEQEFREVIGLLKETEAQ